MEKTTAGFWCFGIAVFKHTDVFFSIRLNQTSISETDEQRFMHRDEAGLKTRRKTKRERLQNEDRVMEGDTLR